jgi:glycosyltransferase 2 family protein
LNAAQRLRLAAGGLLAIVLLAVVLRGVEWSALLSALRDAHRLPLLGLLLVSALTYWIRSWRWGFLLAPLGRVPLARLFPVTMIGFLAGLVIPRAAEVLRPYLVSRTHGIPTSAGFATIVVERLLDLLTVLTLFAVYLFVLPAPPQQTQGPLLNVLKVAGAATAAGAIAVVLLLVAFHRNAARAMSVLDRVFSRLPPRLAGPAGRGLRAFGEGLAVLQAPIGHLLALCGQSFALWLAIAVGFQLNNVAFGIDLPFHATFLLIAFLTVGVSIPTPGMVGGFHAFFLLAMTQAFGIPKDTAVAAGLTAHALSNLPVLILGLVYLGREGLTLGKVAAMTEDKAGDGLASRESAGRAAAPEGRR